jgi:hypothetical protein
MMEPDDPRPREPERAAPAGDNEFSVRLAWPQPRQSSAPPAPEDRFDEEVEQLAPPDDAVPVNRSTSAIAYSTELIRPGGEGNRMGRVFVEAFDRLADRLLERLRSLRQDVDADLAAVRSELASLRQAVEDVGDRVQLRQLRATVDELRGDVTGLRRAVLEWPELEQVSADVAAMRSDLSFLFETSDGSGPGQGPTELLTELQAVVARLSEEAARQQAVPDGGAALAPVLEEVAALRTELTTIRKRMGVRPAGLEADQMEQLVEAVAQRVIDEMRDEAERRSRRR